MIYSVVSAVILHPRNNVDMGKPRIGGKDVELSYRVILLALKLLNTFLVYYFCYTQNLCLGTDFPFIIFCKYCAMSIEDMTDSSFSVLKINTNLSAR